MKKILSYILPAFILLIATKDVVAQPDTWLQKNATGHSQPTGNLSTGRQTGVCFTIGNKAYVGLGYNLQGNKKDFWEYDPATNTWTRKADFPFARQSAVGFCVGNKGYVGMGQGLPSGSENNDFWEYDPTNDTWTRKSDFGGPLTVRSFCFSTSTKGYVGTGSGTKQFWEYDPSADTWTRKADLAGFYRLWAVGFSINDKGYAATGMGSIPGNLNFFHNDLWEYDPTNDTWTRKADLPAGGKSMAVGFSIGNKGYIGTGYRIKQSVEYKKDFWQYDPSTDAWTKKADFGGTARVVAVGFAVNGKGYIGSGQDDQNIVQNDLWEYTVDEPALPNPPTIISVTQNSPCGDSTIIITGTNFIGTTAVKIGGVDVSSFIVNSSTKITAVIGQNANGDLSVATASGTGIFSGFKFINTSTSLHFSPDSIILFNSAATTLHPIITGPVSSFQWSPANLLLDPFSLTPQTSEIKNTTRFTLSVITPEGCNLSDTITIAINNEFYMPTAFTPNGDGKNDLYRIPPGVPLLLADFTIYDKWGIPVFYTEDVTGSWNGKYKNRDCNAGGYVYVVKGVYKNMSVLLKGSFVLIR